MHGQRIGYVRVGSFDQNPPRQLEHVPVDKLFTDKASCKDTERPELERLIAFVREGDTVLVHSMDCLARTLDALMICAAWCRASPSVACASSSSRST